MATAGKKTTLIRTVLLTIAGVLLAGAAGAIVIAYAGTVDVAATNRPSALTHWFMKTTMNHSVAVRAKHIQVPPLDAPGMLEMGADHYHEMCVGCHGAPGIKPDEAAQGLEPPPPELPTKRGSAAMFWIVKNGIQMTGMPAFGKTHDDKKIWAIIAFVKKLHGMSPAEYKKLAGAESEEGDSGHEAQEHDEK